MAKDQFIDYDSTPVNNTDIGSIDIQGTANVLNFDNAFREHMAQHAETVTRHVTKAAGTYTAVKTDYNQLWRATGAVTVNLTAAATLTDGWCIWLKADGGAITVDPNSSETINGASTLTIPNGSGAFVLCNGTAFFSVINGNVTGPASTTDNTLPRFDGTAGALQTSGVSVDDSNNMSVPGAIELGHATDTTVSRAAAGFIAIEGKRVPSPASQAEGDILIRGATEWERLAIGNTGEVVRRDTSGIIWDSPITLVSGKAASGTYVEWTDLPTHIKRVSVLFYGVSTNGTSPPVIQIGDSGGLALSGYAGSVVSLGDATPACDNWTTTDGIKLVQGNNAATALLNGMVTMMHMGSNTWAIHGSLGRSDDDIIYVTTGGKDLTTFLDRVRVTMTNGTDQFDSGSISLTHE